jgi:hypothetical protein
VSDFGSGCKTQRRAEEIHPKSMHFEVFSEKAFLIFFKKVRTKRKP